MIPNIPFGSWTRDYLIDPLRGNIIFDIFSIIVGSMINALEWLFMLLPAWGMAAIFAAIAFWLRGWKFGVFTLLAFMLIDSVNLWAPAMETLALVLVASLVAVAIGIPIGILASRSNVVLAVVRPILDFMQTLPAFVYLIPAIVFFSIGTVPGAFATLIFSMPPAVRLTNLGIRGVDAEVVEAAQAFGAKPRQILFRIQIPLALPTIMAGVNQVIMLALSMVVIAGLVGAGGLGAEVVRSINRLNIPLGVESGVSVVILAVFLDRVSESFASRRRD
jgi:ABC-type proline/glycine betaine transport system permease subunit